MTDSSTTTRVSYTGDGSSTNFTITFPFYLSTDILVQLAGATVASGYSISGGNGSTGTLTMATAPAVGVNVQAILNPPLTQSVNLVDGTAFPSATLNQVNDRAVQIGLRLQDQINRTIRAPDGDSSPVMLLPTATNRANKALMLDSNGNITIGVPNTQVITTDLLAPFLNLSRTAAEAAAGVTPINFAYLPFYIERYGTNTVPGTTDMTAAVQAAINVAKKAGGVIRGITWPYLLTSPIDCTYAAGATTFGFTIEIEGNGAAITQNSPSYPTFLAKHSGVAVFDCTGAPAITFNRVNIGTDTVTFPKCAWLLARNSGGGGSIHRFNNCRVLGSFSEAVVYNYGAEDDQYDACQFFNFAGTANARVMSFTSTNYRSLTSPFTTISSGTQSCIDHKIIGGEYLNWSHSANADVFYLDAISSLKIIGPWAGTADATGGGRSIVFCDTTNGPSNLVTLFGITAENTAHLPSFGVLFGTAAATPSYWVIESCTFPNASLAISAQSLVVCDDFHIKAISNQSEGGGITISGILQNSHIDEMALNISIGTSNNNLLNVSMTNLTVTTSRSGDFWAGPGVQTWTPNTSALTITGALSVSNKRVQYNGSEVTVTMDMSAATSIVCAQGTALTGLPIANTADSAVSLVTNRNTGILIGTAQVLGTSLLLPAISVGAGVVVTITARYFCA